MKSYIDSLRRRYAEPGPMPLAWAILGPRFLVFLPAILSVALSCAVLLAFQSRQDQARKRQEARKWGSEVVTMIEALRNRSAGKMDYSGVSIADLGDFTSLIGISLVGVGISPVAGIQDKPNMAVRLSVAEVPPEGCVDILSSYVALVEGVRVLDARGSVTISRRDDWTALDGMGRIDARAICGSTPKTVEVTFL